MTEVAPDPVFMDTSKMKPKRLLKVLPYVKVRSGILGIHRQEDKD